MKFVSCMLAVLFTLMSLAEFVTGFEWGFRIINAVAAAFWYLFYRLIVTPAAVPRALSVELSSIGEEKRDDDEALSDA